MPLDFARKNPMTVAESLIDCTPAGPRVLDVEFTHPMPSGGRDFDEAGSPPRFEDPKPTRTDILRERPTFGRAGRTPPAQFARPRVLLAHTTAPAISLGSR